MKMLKIGITHGDINGVGYELLLKVLQAPELLEICTPVIFGSPAVAQATAEQINVALPSFYVIKNASEAIDGRINLVHVCSDAEPQLQFGQQTEAALNAEAKSLTAALEAYSHQQIDVLVALPGHLDNDDESHALSNFIHNAFSSQLDSFDWICNQEVRTLVLHQIDASTELGEGLASETLQSQLTAVSHYLRQDFGLMRPRLAVLSASGRLRGDLDELRENGITVFGPFDAEKFAENGLQHHYDGCILLDEQDVRDRLLADMDPEFTIGYVSGLPMVLTYPHQDIDYAHAGQGLTNEVPLRQAIFAAIDIARNRHAYYVATRHPLEKQWIPRGRDDFKLDLTKDE